MRGGENSGRWGLVEGSGTPDIPLKINLVPTMIPPGAEQPGPTTSPGTVEPGRID